MYAVYPRLVINAACRCVDPILTIVAAMAHGRSVFVSPPDKRAEAAAARGSLTAGSAAAKSDHLAVIAAFNAWTAALAKGGRQQAHSVSQHLSNLKCAPDMHILLLN